MHNTLVYTSSLIKNSFVKEIIVNCVRAKKERERENLYNCKIYFL